MRILAVIIALCVGCAGASGRGARTPEEIVRSEMAPRSLVDAATGKNVDMEAFRTALRTKTVVYVGERHDRPGDHGAQYTILRTLHSDQPSLAIGMEMFQAPFQEPLDRWSAGEIDETVLRRDTEYDERWGYDFSLYRPILEFARSRNLRVVALNAPRELAHAVAMSGVEGLDAELAASMPELDLDDAEHRALFDEAFDAGDHGGADMVDRYYQAQVLWDETMGSRVAETLEGPDSPAAMIVFAGRVHVQGGLGIPDRAAKRGATPYVVVLPVTPAELKAELKKPTEERLADFFWTVDP
jgi:uncharacterized iron-regulated protein